MRIRPLVDGVAETELNAGWSSGGKDG